MDIGYSFKWALVYRAIAVGALVLGLALVVVGLFAGFGGAVTTLVSDPLDPGPAVAQANPAITLLFCVLGVVVWQVGKTYALFLTLPRAAGRAAARRFDSERVASDVAEELDDRLAAMETELTDTRRELEVLKRRSSGQTTSYDEREHPEPSTDADATGTTTVERDGADPSDETVTRPVPASASTAASDTADSDGDSGADAADTTESSEESDGADAGGSSDSTPTGVDSTK